MEQKERETARYLLKIVGSEIKLERPEEFEKSFFREEYRKVLRAVNRVVKVNEANRENRENSDRAERYYPDIRIHNIVPIIGPRGSGKSSILHTVAGFLQDGDTKDLKEKIEDEGSSFFREFYGKKGLFDQRRFFVTESIDGSLLEPHEDILPSILARMKQLLPEDDFYLRKRGEGRIKLIEVKKKLQELYRIAEQMERRDTRNDDMEYMTPSTSFEDRTHSLNVRQELKNLLVKFLDFYLEHRSAADRECHPVGRRNEPVRPEDCYLVIPIDDLDLNVDHGYEMLEKLHRYLMVPNVIILMDFDQDQFKRLCEKYYYRMIPTYDSRMNAVAPTLEALARQYLEKVMPLDLRTYVPLLSVPSDLRVSLEMEQEEHYYLPKHLVFKLLYEKLGIRMDTDGEKRHFLERNSLRNYVNLLRLLQDMENPFQGTGKNQLFRDDVYCHNHRIFRQAITQGMATAWLSDAVVYDETVYADDFILRRSPPSPKAKFDKITEALNPIPRTFHNLFRDVLREASEVEALNPIPRTFRNLFRDVRREASEVPEGIELRELAETLTYYGFSYGEILHIIYKYGRIDREKNKRLIHALLSFYSLVMNQSYLNLRQQQNPMWLAWKNENAERERNHQQPIDPPIQRDSPYRDEFLKLMNGSVSGSWANGMVPVVRVDPGANIPRYYGAGLRKVNDMSLAFNLDPEKIYEYITHLSCSNLRKMRSFYHSVLIVGMLFDCPNYDLPEQFHVADYAKTQAGETGKGETRQELVEVLLKDAMQGDQEDQKYQEDQEDNIEIAKPNLGPISGKGTFGFLNFVSSAFRYRTYLQKLLIYTNNYCLNNSDLFPGEQLAKHVGNIHREIEASFAEWDRKYGSFALPLYDLDVCYNLIKRLLRDQDGKPGYIDNSTIDRNSMDYTFLFDKYMDVYRAIAKRLYSNDAVYEDEKGCHVELGEQRPRSRYANAFCECPFIQWLGIRPPDRTIEQEIEEKRKNYGRLTDDDKKAIETAETIPSTLYLTKRLLEDVFRNLTQNNLITQNNLSESHLDGADYTRTKGYDD